mmetsp:Transcript_14539/g.58008  ORF Transcript_14539/g.58008 Transcript_14539/m.58008 type:complete len:331 (+) Transcript_14539:797-1789(+)
MSLSQRNTTMVTTNEIHFRDATPHICSFQKGGHCAVVVLRPDHGGIGGGWVRPDTTCPSRRLFSFHTVVFCTIFLPRFVAATPIFFVMSPPSSSVSVCSHPATGRSMHLRRGLLHHCTSTTPPPPRFSLDDNNNNSTSQEVGARARHHEYYKYHRLVSRDTTLPDGGVRRRRSRTSSCSSRRRRPWSSSSSRRRDGRRESREGRPGGGDGGRLAGGAPQYGRPHEQTAPEDEEAEPRVRPVRCAVAPRAPRREAVRDEDGDHELRQHLDGADDPDGGRRDERREARERELRRRDEDRRQQHGRQRAEQDLLRRLEASVGCQRSLKIGCPG